MTPEELIDFELILQLDMTERRYRIRSIYQKVTKNILSKYLKILKKEIGHFLNGGIITTDYLLVSLKRKSDGKYYQEGL